MKKYLVFAAAAALLTACSGDDLTVATQQAPQAADGEVPVLFEAYTSRGTTRAGDDGILTTSTADDATHKISLQAAKKGFGVFGYYTDGEPYSGITKPNFMYNQHVHYSTNWTYDPIKYWPNEFGGDAISDQVDRVTFFAYAPYVEVDPLTGIVKNDPNNNIMSMTRNNNTGDPFIKYSSTMDPTNSTDLCYGVAASDFTSSNSTINRNDIKKGDPYINVVKPSTDDPTSKIKFDFKHALAQLVVTIDADVKDLTTNPTSTEVDKKTKIWVRSVTFEGVTQKGALNLNSTATSPEWYDVNGQNNITTGSLTVFDGRKNGKEALDTATTEAPSSLNHRIIQSGKYTYPTVDTQLAIDAYHPGVTATPVNLFNSNGTNMNTDPVFVIPTGEKMKVTVVYDVETLDPNLAFYLSDGNTPGSTIENSITKTIETFGNIEAGKRYVLNLHLGMRTVDFDAEVTPWVDVTAESYHPNNVPVYAVGKSHDIELAHNVTSFSFGISGYDSGTGTTSASVSPVSGTIENANTSGVAYGTLTITPSNSVVKNTDGKFTITATSGGFAETVLKVTQLAAPLGLSASKLASGGTTITLTPTATGTDFTYTSNLDTDDRIKVVRTRAGVDKELEHNTTAGADTYQISGTTTGTLVLGAGAVAGDIYTITIRMKDAAAETVKVIVPAP